MRNLCAIAILGLLSCGGDGSDSDGGSSGPSSTQVRTAQEADAATGSTNTMTRAASEAVVADGSGGESLAQLPKTGSLPAAPPRPRNSFDFQAQIDVTVDLDATTSTGADMYPNATGLLSVSATGAVNPGAASYTVAVSCLTDCTFTDPASGESATVGAGSGFSFQLDVAWTWTSVGNWSISWSSGLSVSGFVTSGGTLSGSRQASGSASATGGVKTWSYDASGAWTVTTPLHVVVIETQVPGGVTITIDGIVFGPYTWVEVLQIFGIIP